MTHTVRIGAAVVAAGMWVGMADEARALASTREWTGGGALAEAADAATAILGNPAALAGVEDVDLALRHDVSPMAPEAARQDIGAFAAPGQGGAVLGAALADTDGGATPEGVVPAATSLTLGVGRPISRFADGGVSVTGVQLRRDGGENTELVARAGVLFQVGPGARVGAVWSSAEGLRVDSRWTLGTSAAGPLAAGIAGWLGAPGGARALAGVTQEFAHGIAVRAGYFAGPGTVQQLVAGAGGAFRNVRVDYGYLPGPAGNGALHRVTVTARFGRIS